MPYKFLPKAIRLIVSFLEWHSDFQRVDQGEVNCDVYCITTNPDLLLMSAVQPIERNLNLININHRPITSFQMIRMNQPINYPHNTISA